MAKLKLPSFADGSLLQRTMLYVVTFVVGSAGFVAIASLIVVSAAKALVPVRSTDSSASATDKAAAEIAPVTAMGKPSSKRARPSKVKTPVEAEGTAPEDTH